MAYIPIKEHLARLEEQGKRITRRLDRILDDIEFLTDMLLTRPTRDMEAQRRLLREWEEEADRLKEDRDKLRDEYKRLKRN